MNKLQAVVIASAVALTGCASILNEKTQNINVSTTNNKEVTGTVNGQAFKAPGVVAVTRENKIKTFVVTDPACTKETVAEKSVDGKFFLNVLITSPLGTTIDVATEKMWSYAPSVDIKCK